MLHFPGVGCKRACVASTDSSALSSSSAALRIFSRMELALISWERVPRYSSMRTDSGASGDPSTSRISGIVGPDLLFNHRPIPPPDLAPPTVQPLPLTFFEAPERILGRRLLIYLNAPAGSVIGIPVAVLHHRTTLENFLRALRKRRILLDAKIVTRDIQCDIAHRSNGRKIARAVPGCAYVKRLAQRSNLARGREPTHHRWMNANEIDQPLGNQRSPFQRMREQLAHGQLRRALFANQPEVIDILRRQHVLQKEQPELLYISSEAHGLYRMKPLMNIMQQLDLVPKFLAGGFEKLHGPPHVHCRFKHRTIVQCRNSSVP